MARRDSEYDNRRGMNSTSSGSFFDDGSFDADLDFRLPSIDRDEIHARRMNAEAPRTQRDGYTGERAATRQPRPADGRYEDRSYERGASQRRNPDDRYGDRQYADRPARPRSDRASYDRSSSQRGSGRSSQGRTGSTRAYPERSGRPAPDRQGSRRASSQRDAGGRRAPSRSESRYLADRDNRLSDRPAARSAAHDRAIQAASSNAPAGRHSKRPSNEEILNEYSRSASRNRAGAERKGKSRRKIAIIVVLALLGAVLLGGLAYALNFVHGINTAIHANLDDEVTDALVTTGSNQEPFYMLLVGVDRSENRMYGTESEEYGNSFRTDSIILARIDPQQKTITLISIHRDIMVDLSAYGGTGQDKLNSAYLYGGQALITQVVSEVAGVPISHYAEIDFEGFAAVVDALGGVDVDVEYDAYDEYLDCYFTAGWQTLDGQQALNYARARHAFDEYGDGDVFRAKHQRQVLAAIAKKVLNSDAATLTSTVQTLANYVTTDLSVGDLVDLALSFRGIDVDNNVYSAMTPTYGEIVDGTWFEFLDQEAWTSMMNNVNAGLPPYEGSNSGSDNESSSPVQQTSGVIIVKLGNDDTTTLEQAVDRLNNGGIPAAEVGDADSHEYGTTLIIYEDGSYRDFAGTVQATLGVGEVMENDGSYNLTGDILVVIGSDWA